VAIVKGHPEQATAPVLVRVRSECLTGDAFGSLRCDCRPQLEAALRMIEAAGEGLVVYLRQEGRGIGLINKLKAYALQDGGLDTVEANERLGFAADLRNYGVGAQILSDLGVRRLRLITNNPRKIAGLGGYGLQVEDRVPLVMDPGLHNAAYLQVKRTKLGHLLDVEAHGLTAVLTWRGLADPDQRAAAFASLQHWADQQALLLEFEQDPRLLALLDQPELALLLGSTQGQQLSAEQLAAGVQLLANQPYTEVVALLLAPDRRRVAHPSASLEPETRPLADLQLAPDRSCPRLAAQSGAFIVWR
jgi:3,4-dihydroxy 2-butanone 4-phosphate synthase/GTP cyclohydrolase II